jgi:DNA-directed RNA polymerase subunit RPC12/RpoP
VSDTCGCSRPTTGEFLCPACRDELEQLAAELPAMIGHLYDAMGGLMRFSGERVGGRASKDETGIRLAKAASEAADQLRGFLHRCVRLLIEHGHAHPIRMPADELEPMARFLYGHLAGFRMLEDVYALKEELRRITGRVAAAVNSPVERVYAGKCSVDTQDGECPQEMYAVKGKPFIECPRCGFRHEVAARQEVMRRAAEDTLMTAKELAAALPNLMGVPLKPATLRSWKNWKRLHPQGETYTGEDLYLVKDVLDLAVQAAARQDKKAS